MPKLKRNHVHQLAFYICIDVYFNIVIVYLFVLSKSVAQYTE
jgi:hypothetical protein